MSKRESHQPLGRSVPDWSARQHPGSTPMVGRTCRLEPLQADRHGDDLYRNLVEAGQASDWTYLPTSPPADATEYLSSLSNDAASLDPMPHAVISAVSEQALGRASYMRIDRQNGSIEVGFIHYAPSLQRTVAGTEAMYLMMRRAFDELGYRRYEWKCDALNAPSRAAALRYGFTFEGVFRQAVVYKGRNRDTAWFSIVDEEWPAIRAAFETWLDPANFDETGRQRTALRAARQAKS